MQAILLKKLQYFLVQISPLNTLLGLQEWLDFCPKKREREPLEDAVVKHSMDSQLHNILTLWLRCNLITWVRVYSFAFLWYWLNHLEVLNQRTATVWNTTNIIGTPIWLSALPLSSFNIEAHVSTSRSDQVDSHPSTVLAHCSLTSAFEWELVFPTCHGRWLGYTLLCFASKAFCEWMYFAQSLPIHERPPLRKTSEEKRFLLLIIKVAQKIIIFAQRLN